MTCNNKAPRDTTLRRRVQDKMNKDAEFCKEIVQAAIENGGIKTRDMFTTKELINFMEA